MLGMKVYTKEKSDMVTFGYECDEKTLTVTKDGWEALVRFLSDHGIKVRETRDEWRPGVVSCRGPYLSR